MFINNKKRCFIDRISETCVIKLVDVNSKDPDGLLNTSKPIKRNYGLPGDIVSNASDEIDGL
jgi:signal peptidase I